MEVSGASIMSIDVLKVQKRAFNFSGFSTSSPLAGLLFIPFNFIDSILFIHSILIIINKNKRDCAMFWNSWLFAYRVMCNCLVYS